MKNKILRVLKKIFNPTIFLAIIFGLFFYHLNSGIMDIDDIVYRNAFNSFQTFLEWVHDFYNVWSGRITLTLLITVFTNIPIVFFKLFNVTLFIISIFSMRKIAELLLGDLNKLFKNLSIFIFFCLIFLISVPVISSGCLWIAGAMNYLLPLSMMLIGIIPPIAELTNRNLSKKYYIFAMISNIFSCFSEQASAILLVFVTISIIWNKIEKRKISKYLKLHLLIISIFSAVSLLAPGNMARSHAEMLAWYQSFEMLSFFDKIVQVVINVSDHLINSTTLLFSMITILSSFLIITNKKINKHYKYVAIILMYIYIYIVLMRLVLSDLLIKLFPDFNVRRIINKVFFNFKLFSVLTFYDKKSLVDLSISSYLIIMVAIQLIYAFKNKKTGIIVSILYCASICSSLVIGFSPTVFASGNRIYTITDFLLVLINGILWIQLFNNFLEKNENKFVFRFKIFIFIFIMMLIFMDSYETLYLNGINQVTY